MSIDATEKFLLDLKASSVASASDLDHWLAITKNPNDPRKLADLLVANGNLTRWQANYLLSGRNRLRFGNYVLTDRGNRSRLGDAFIGRHEQLDRLVNILFLAKDVSSRLAQNGSLIRELAASGDVDHPNLEHVHLIDQESDRYMLVTDHINGKSLNDSELLMSLKPTDLPGILRQTMQAVDHLHAAGFSHGNLTEKSLIVDSNLNLTVTDLVDSILARSLSQNLDRSGRDGTAEAKDDIQAIAVIGRRLIARLSSHDTGDTTDRVRVITEKLANSEIGLADAIDSLKTLEKGAGKTALEKTAPVRAIASSSSLSKPDASLAAHDVAEKPLKKIAGDGSSATLLRKGMSVLVAVLIATIAFVLVAKVWFGGDSKTNIAAKSKESDAGTTDLPSLPPVFSDSASVPASIPEVEDIEPRNDTELDNPALPTPRSNMSELPGETDIPALPNPDKPALPDVALLKTERDRPDTNTDSTGADSILSAYKSAGGDVQTSQAESDRPADDSPEPVSDDSGKSTPGTVDPDPSKTNGASRSDRLPDSVELPPTSMSEFRRLFAIEPIQGTLILELVSDENISRSKAEFALSANRDGQWTVQMFDPRDSAGNPVANFTNQNGSIEFSWLEGAKELTNANYLRNCVLRLKWDNGTKTLALRQPVIVEGFLLRRDEPRIRLEIADLEYLPKNPVAELHELDEEIYGTTYLVPEGRTDRLISGKNGLEVHFSDLPEYQMAYLELSSELKNRPRLEAALLLRMIPNQKSRSATSETLDAAGSQLEEYFQTVKINHDGLKGMKIDELRRQFNLSSDRFKNEHKLAKVKELQQEMEFSEKRAKTFREIRTRLEVFYERQIPVSISFEVDGQRVILAKTTVE